MAEANRPTVKSNTGEVAVFTDGHKVVRQRINLSPIYAEIYSEILKPVAFKRVFRLGATDLEVIDQLKAPDVASGTGGVADGSPHRELVTVTPKGINIDLKKK